MTPITYFDRYTYDEQREAYLFFLHDQTKPSLILPKDPKRGFTPPIHSLIQLLSELQHEAGLDV